MLGCLIGIVWSVWSGDAALKRNMLPWLGIGAYVLANAALAAVTRIGFGVNQRLDSRYTTFSLWLSVSLAALNNADGRNRLGIAIATVPN